MAEVIMANLKVCEDCAHYSANRHVEDSNGDDITAMQGQAIRRAWEGWEDATTGRFPELVLDYRPDGEGDASPDAGFSHMPCDGCDSPLGGNRFRAALIG